MTVWIYVDTRKQVGDKDHLSRVRGDHRPASQGGHCRREPIGFPMLIRR